MMFDPKNHEHREALAWACGMTPQDIHIWRTTAHAPLGLSLDICAVALTALSDPARAAEVLRGLLEACGVDVAEINPRPMRRMKGGTDEWKPIVGWGAEDERWHGVDMTQLSTLFLALLDIPTDAPNARDRALAALREASR